MVMARKAESETEEAKDKVRARLAATTEVVDGTKDLSTQIRALPFKEHYKCIPPHMYDDMRAHIQEMLDIGAISR